MEGILQQYLDGLASKRPEQVPFAQGIRYTENNVEMPIGEGVWGTIAGLGDYRLTVADIEQGQVGFYGLLHEPKSSSPFALRLKVVNKRITEAEIVVLRYQDEPKGIVWPEPTLEYKPLFHQDLPPAARRERARLISIADGYFDTLQLNDGTLFTQFHPQCNRIENGTQTTNNTKVAITSVGSLGCEEQFKLGNYRYDDRLRGRRFPLVDVDRGLVMAGGFIDHSGRMGRYTLTDGREVDSPIRYPHSFYLLELFKIDDGRIRQIEAVFVTVPYLMPSPWDKH
ncbi:MAG: hypothetical protein H6978_02360 [Gammaproteobacteria bacterium]|nr:hypothetical protein [Gammaproteobacteria bacterium]